MIESAPPYDRNGFLAIERIFHQEHEQRFTYALTELPIECLHWRVAAIGRMPVTAHKAPLLDGGHASVRVDERDAYVAGKGQTSFAIHHLESLKSDVVIDGPAILQAPTTTVLLMDGDRLRAQSDRSSLIDIGVNEA